MRVMTEDDLDATDEVVRLAFGTFHSLADPAKAFGDADRVRTRFRAARLRLVAELDGEVVGAVFVTHLGRCCRELMRCGFTASPQPRCRRRAPGSRW